MSNPTSPSLAERLEECAAQHVTQHSVQARSTRLQQIITAREILRRLRNIGHSWFQLAAWLGDCNVPVSPNTVRVYLSRIDRAEKGLEARDPSSTPSDQEILIECQRNLIGLSARNESRAGQEREAQGNPLAAFFATYPLSPAAPETVHSKVS